MNKALGVALLSILCAASSSSIDAVGVPGCPNASSLSVTTDVDTPVNFQLQGSDPDGDSITYAVISPPAHGTVVVATQTGAATYTPSAGYCGPDSFAYTVSDGSCISAPATVSITVECPAQNRCPTADPVTVSVNQDSSVSFSLLGSDSDGDPVTYSISQPPSHGVLVVTSNTGASTYTPNAGYCGHDSFAYTVNDGQCDSSPATVTIDVVCVTPVSIDIKPGSNPNSFKCGSNGVVTVAILSSATFNATTINKPTVKMETAGGLISVLAGGAKIKDVNGDGRLDLVVQFSSPAISAGIGCPLPVNTNVQVTVKGATLGGANFAGLDSLRIVGP